MQLSDADIVDLAYTTLKDLGRMRFQQIAQPLQDYEVMGRWLKKDKVTFDSGRGILYNLQEKYQRARHVGMYAQDDVNVIDLLKQLDVPWRYLTHNYAWERRELIQNSGTALVTKIMEPRRASTMLGIAQELEEKAWSSPAAGNTTDPYGLPYWVVKNASTGFNGGAPSGHSTVGGINPSNFEGGRWNNYSGTYTNVTKADLVRSLRMAFRKIGFQSPISIPDFRKGRGDRYRNYVNDDTIVAIEEIGEQQNENLGRDIASMDDVITFRRTPIVWVPQLDADTENPWYMIDHSVFYPVCLSGDYLRESKPSVVAGQHNVFAVYVDLTYNFVCVDRRRNAVLYQVAE